MPDRICSVATCERPSRKRGWCTKHYKRWRDTGSPTTPPRPKRNGPQRIPLETRFREKLAQVIKTETGCWIWPFGKTTLGYGQLSAGGRSGKVVMAHRISWELHRGPIPDGYHIDHLCRTPSCVNPDHLEPVTRSVNAQRGLMGNLGAEHRAAEKAERWAEQPDCPHGHKYTPENTRISRIGRRQCRRCGLIRTRAYREAQRQGVPYVDPFKASRAS